MFELDLLGGDALETELTGLAAGLDDPAPWLSGNAAKVAGNSIRKHFEKGGLPDAWPDITAKSRAQRKVNKTSGPLIDSGALMEAASAEHAGVSGSVFAQDGDTLTLGTDMVYAATQEFGRSQGSGEIPVRPFMQLTPEDEIKLMHSMDDDYLHKLLAKMG